MSHEDQRREQVTGAGGEGGFALLTVILVLVGFTALATAGFMLSGGDLRVSENLHASTRAYFAANAGLYQYMGTRAVPSDTQTYTYGNATATVWGTRLLDVTSDQPHYRIASVGRYTARGATATRRVSTTAILTSGNVSPKASFTAGSGLVKNGSSGTISGHDWSPPGSCSGAGSASVAGVAVPPGGYTQSGGGELVPEGEPAIDSTQTAVEHLQDTGIDWAGILAGSVVAPDYTIPPDSWPDFSQLGGEEYPVIYLDQDSYEVAPENSGRGTLIVRGNLHINGSFDWDGLLLVGGTLTSNGYQTVEGATITGLNLLLGESLPSSDIGNGNKEFKYHSCNLIKATRAAFGGLAEKPGTWAEEM